MPMPEDGNTVDGFNVNAIPYIFQTKGHERALDALSKILDGVTFYTKLATTKSKEASKRGDKRQRVISKLEAVEEKRESKHMKKVQAAEALAEKSEKRARLPTPLANEESKNAIKCAIAEKDAEATNHPPTFLLRVSKALSLKVLSPIKVEHLRAHHVPTLLGISIDRNVGMHMI